MTSDKRPTPLEEVPEELAGPRALISQKQWWVATCILVLATAVVAVTLTLRKAPQRANGQPSHSANTNFSSGDRSRETQLLVDTAYRLSANSETRTATYSFGIHWTGGGSLQVRYNGDNLPPGLRYLPGSDIVATTLRPNQSATLTVDFSVPHCGSVAGGSWSIQLSIRDHPTSEWRNVIIDPPVPRLTDRWQLLIQNAVCQADPSAVDTHH
jgi:hypothetical protein